MFSTVLCNKILNGLNHTGLITMAELATLQWNRKNQKNNIRKSRNYINSNEENSRNFKNGSKFYTSRATDLEKENNESITEAQTLLKT